VQTVPQLPRIGAMVAVFVGRLAVYSSWVT
jgi:hypothetical protein